jgi:hypothetical protein
MDYATVSKDALVNTPRPAPPRRPQIRPSMGAPVGDSVGL